MKRTLISAVASIGLFAGAAMADTVVKSVEGDAASVLVRDGQVVELVAGTAILTGDRIISAEGSQLTIANADCERSFAGQTALVITEDFCDQESGSSFGGAGVEFGLEGDTTTGVLALLVAAGVAGTVIAVAGDDDNEDLPTSP